MTTSSSLSGRRVGNFDIGPLIGAGGMGEVYRGRDTRLNREVAIKVLLPAVAGDAERLARFNREAQVLASITHPNIAQIHGVVEGDAGPLLILEFVDGPTLADRIAQGPLPIDDAIAIAKQIVEALEAAHERGVVHRDLKPANIKVDDHGTVKVLDFGLAKALEPGTGSGEPGAVADSPTITSPAMTQAGMILGTAAYMSPEQAKGRAVDKRSDIWAFGCVLYEMLTGTRAFGGEDVTDTIAAVVRAEPDWTKLPAQTPSQLRLLLKRCLDKDRKNRIADISTARFLIDEKLGAVEPPAAPRRMAATIAVAAIVVVALIGASAWSLSPRATTPAAPIVQFEMRPPPGASLLPGPGSALAVAPDGSFVVFRAVRTEGDGRETSVPSMLMIRAWNELEPRELPDTRNARSPFVSPDGQWIGFFGGGQLRKVPVGGGTSVAICSFRGLPAGASWGDDDHIVFASSEVEGLQRVSANGGEPVRLTTPERSKRDRHRLPQVLPGSRHVMFAEFDAAANVGTVRAVEVATGAVKTVLRDAFHAGFTDTGHLVYSSPLVVAQRQARATLRAVRFDVSRVEVSGDSVALIDPIAFEANVPATFSVSRRGHLAYLPEGTSIPRMRQLVWVDRKGEETTIPAPPREYGIARISPDGGRVVMDVRGEGGGIWFWDLMRQTFSPLDRDETLNSTPLWMPDGKHVLWSSTRAGGNPKLFTQAADGTGTAEQLTTEGGTTFATSVSLDGRTVLVFGSRLAGAGSFDINQVTLGGAKSVIAPLVATSSQEGGAELSPDGKWIAYHSNESGESQVYVRPYPNVDAGRWQMSNAGGSRPAWSRNGRELFYLNRDAMLMAVPVLPAAAGQFSAGLPAQVLKTSYVAGSTSLGLAVRAYDVSPDGQRFLMIKEPPQPADAPPPRLVFVINWGEELKARLPTP